MSLPAITCVCITKNRPAFLKKAIDCFNAQTYQNKNLVVVCEYDDELYPEAISDNEQIRIIRLPPGCGLSLGERRNLSIQHCDGDYFCQWDDDDWYHIKRLERQMEALVASGKSACVLSRLILYDGIKHRAYLSSQRYWEGSLLCRTDLICDSMRYPGINRGEDNSLVVRLVTNDHVHALSLPYLYAYFFHGNNTWDIDHFSQLFQAGYKLNQRTNAVLKKVFQGEFLPRDASQIVQGLPLEEVLANRPRFQPNSLDS